QLGISASMVLTLSSILQTSADWVFQALYIPALIPFFLVTLISFYVYRLDRKIIRQICAETYERIALPSLSLFGALAMVQLLMMGGDTSMVMIIGERFADASGNSWQLFAPLLGALGWFFSGSATVSNLTFAGIQDSVATDLGLDRSLILSLQSVGAAMGNMVCINNIVAVCSILGLSRHEGWILKRTIGPMFVYALIAAIAGLAL
ncbi:MAG: L-lactate permease, partial [Pseudomonadota bacterium]